MSLHYDDGDVRLIEGNVLEASTFDVLGDGEARAIVTSPPYWGLRDYGVDGQLGNEPTVEEYVENLVEVFASLRRVLADDGTVWLNLGDTYGGAGSAGAPSSRSTLRGNGHVGGGPKQASGAGRPSARRDRASVPRRVGARSKNLVGVPWRVALALQADGWVLRSEVIWSKPNAMPESVSDRPTRAHEHIFLLAKRPSYFYDAEAIATEYEGDRAASRRARSGRTNKQNSVASEWSEDAAAGGRANKRSVWEVPTQPFPGSHFAVYPPELIRPCVRASTQIGDVVLDPFNGSGTTGLVARQEGRRYVGIDLNREYLDLSLRTRFVQPVMDIWGGDAA